MWLGSRAEDPYTNNVRPSQTADSTFATTD
jgi:hypothetical protein